MERSKKKKKTNTACYLLSREKLLRALWDDERFVDDNTLTVNINRLRRKIEQAGIQGYIETKVGQGYIVP